MGEGLRGSPGHPRALRVTLPHWEDGSVPPKSLSQLRDDMALQDTNQLQSKGLQSKFLQTIGFDNFNNYMDVKIEQLFVEGLGPVCESLTNVKDELSTRLQDLEEDHRMTDQRNVMNTCREVAVSFGKALTHVMEGVPFQGAGRMTLHRSCGSSITITGPAARTPSACSHRRTSAPWTITWIT